MSASTRHYGKHQLPSLPTPMAYPEPMVLMGKSLFVSEVHMMMQRWIHNICIFILYTYMIHHVSWTFGTMKDTTWPAFRAQLCAEKTIQNVTFRCSYVILRWKAPYISKLNMYGLHLYAHFSNFSVSDKYPHGFSYSKKGRFTLYVWRRIAPDR